MLIKTVTYPYQCNRRRQHGGLEQSRPCRTSPERVMDLGQLERPAEETLGWGAESEVATSFKAG